MLKLITKNSLILLSTIALVLAGLGWINPVTTENTDIVLANPAAWYDHPQTEPLTTTKAVFLGDSLTAGYAVENYFPNCNLEVSTAGVSGEKSFETLQRLDEEFYSLNPKKLFLLIGTNDLAHKTKTPFEVATSIKQIILELQTNLPYTEIFLESIYPVNTKDFPTKKAELMVANRTNQIITEVNRELIRVAGETQITYIDVYPYLLDSKEQLKKEFSIEGLHLTEAGYKKVSEVLLPYLKN